MPMFFLVYYKFKYKLVAKLVIFNRIYNKVWLKPRYFTLNEYKMHQLLTFGCITVVVVEY